jgi:hypothetical protein
MTAVARLVTFVDVDDRAGEARRMSVSARHEAALADGRRVLLLDDRGWSSTALRRFAPTGAARFPTTIRYETSPTAGP